MNGKREFVPFRNVDIRVNEGHAGEVTIAFDYWPVVRVTYELGITKSMVQSVMDVSDGKNDSPVQAYWMIGVQTLYVPLWFAHFVCMLKPIAMLTGP